MARSSHDVESIVGREVNLTCDVLTGNPAPTITWTRQGELVKSSARIVDDASGNLYLKNVSVDDEGQYVCTASNVAGSASTSIELDVLGNRRLLSCVVSRIMDFRTQNFVPHKYNQLYNSSLIAIDFSLWASRVCIVAVLKPIC